MIQKAAAEGRGIPNLFNLKINALEAYKLGQVLNFYENELSRKELIVKNLTEGLEEWRDQVVILQNEKTRLMSIHDRLIEAPKKNDEEETVLASENNAENKNNEITKFGVLVKKWSEPAMNVTIIVAIIGMFGLLFYVFIFA